MFKKLSLLIVAGLMAFTIGCKESKKSSSYKSASSPREAYEEYVSAIKFGSASKAAFYLTGATQEEIKQAVNRSLKAYNETGIIEEILDVREEGNIAYLLLSTDQVIVFTKESDAWKYNIRETALLFAGDEEDFPPQETFQGNALRKSYSSYQGHSPRVAYEAYVSAIKRGDVEGAMQYVTGATPAMIKEAVENTIKIVRETNEVESVVDVREEGDNAYLTLSTDQVVVFTKEAGAWKFHLRKTLDFLLQKYSNE